MPEAVVYESHRQRERIKDEITGMERTLNRIDKLQDSGLVESGSFANDVIGDNMTLEKQCHQRKKHLDSVTPPNIEELEEKGIKRKAMIARTSQLADFIVNDYGQFPRMRSQEEMDLCPAGAVDMNLLYHKKICHHNIAPNGNIVNVDHGKGELSCHTEYKNLMRILNADREEELDSSIANLEMLRPGKADSKDSLTDFTRRTYQSPTRNLTAQEFEDRVGIEGLNPLMKYIHDLEKKDELKAPTFEDHFKKLFSHDDEPDKGNGDKTPEPTIAAQGNGGDTNDQTKPGIKWLGGDRGFDLPDGRNFKKKKDAEAALAELEGGK